MKKNKCPYCNKILTYDKDYCNEYCKNKYINFINYIQKYSKLFITTIILVCISTFLCALISIPNKALGEKILSFTFILFGIIIIIFPFSTPETFKYLGVRLSTRITRILGLIVFLFGLFFQYS